MKGISLFVVLKVLVDDDGALQSAPHGCALKASISAPLALAPSPVATVTVHVPLVGYVPQCSHISPASTEVTEPDAPAKVTVPVARSHVRDRGSVSSPAPKVPLEVMPRNGSPVVSR